MPKPIFALSNTKENSRTPFMIACEQILGLSKKYLNLEFRVRDLENLPKARDGRDGLNGRDGEKGDLGPSGLGGKSITKVEIEEECLIITLDGIENNLGRIVGRDGIGIQGLMGPVGKDGESIKGDPGRDGKDGKSIQGPKGNPGESIKGDPGQNGISITDVKINDNELIIYLDGNPKNLGRIVGQDGKDGKSIQGEKGEPGQSIKGDPGKDGTSFDSTEFNKLELKVNNLEVKVKEISIEEKMEDRVFEKKLKDLLGYEIKIGSE